jgi:hypothetical protein
MRVCVRWNNEFAYGCGKPWKVLYDNQEIFCDRVIFSKGGYTQTIEISDQNQRSHMCVDAEKIINDNGIVRFE